MPKVAAAHARKTCRLDEALGATAFACGGEGGARLATQLGMPTSPDTLLRRIRRASPDPRPTPRVLGVDEWAIRRGARYGTILCDLERGRPVDLLDERSAQSFSAWLTRHAGVEVICRDRAGCYSCGGVRGAPKAIQIADRWHLLDNLHQALVRVLDRHHRQVREAARRLVPAQGQRVESAITRPTPQSPVPNTHAQQLQQARRGRRMQRYEQVMELHRQGLSRRSIARHLGLNRETVGRYIRSDGFPERASRQYPSRIDPFDEYLRRRWLEGCHSASQLTNELVAQGYDGSYTIVRRHVAGWRRPETADERAVLDPRTAALAIRTPSSKRVIRMILGNQQSLEPAERAFLITLRRRCSEVRRAVPLARWFVRMIHHRRPEALNAWIACTRRSGVPGDLKTFANAIRADAAAVRAAIAFKWSTGPVEGQINRVKLIKRQMYGRAKFDLLRQRVLHTG